MNPNPIPPHVALRTKAAMQQTLRLARLYPRLYRLQPVASVLLAIALGVYSLMHLWLTYLVVFSP